MTGNGIPDHDVGTFPNANCPNTISAWSASAAVTLTPVDTGTASDIQIVGYALNGVKFDPSTAGTCTVSGCEHDAAASSATRAPGTSRRSGQSSFNFGVDEQQRARAAHGRVPLPRHAGRRCSPSSAGAR